MYLLNFIIVSIWVLIALQSAYTVYDLRKQRVSRPEVTAVTILLLCGLNICSGLIAIAEPQKYRQLVEYFYIGQSVFQILLCNIVLKHINIKSNKGKS